ncbi:MAG: hypothetical protein KAS70_08435 [Planctomycetes bacterium]|nr:hypothetical protein [Planctomycetota bacterium]
MVKKYFCSFLFLILIASGTGLVQAEESLWPLDSKSYNLHGLTPEKLYPISIYEEDEDPPPHSLAFEQFSVQFWGGTLRLRKSESKMRDLNNSLTRTKKDFDDNIGLGGIKFENIYLYPESKKTSGRWFTMGLNIYGFETTYPVILANGVITQTNKIGSANLIIMVNLKIAPNLGRIKPYISFGIGPAWTRVRVERTSEDGINTPVLDHSRNIDATAAVEAGFGIEFYLGKHAYLTVEAKGMKLTNEYELFYDRATKAFTHDLSTTYQGSVSSFGLAIRF